MLWATGNCSWAESPREDGENKGDKVVIKDKEQLLGLQELFPVLPSPVALSKDLPIYPMFSGLRGKGKETKICMLKKETPSIWGVGSANNGFSLFAFNTREREPLGKSGLVIFTLTQLLLNRAFRHCPLETLSCHLHVLCQPKALAAGSSAAVNQVSWEYQQSAHSHSSQMMLQLQLGSTTWVLSWYSSAYMGLRRPELAVRHCLRMQRCTDFSTPPFSAISLLNPTQQFQWNLIGYWWVPSCNPLFFLCRHSQTEQLNKV